MGQKNAMFTRTTHKTDSWRTPKWLFDVLNKEFGFVLDAAASRQNALCAKFYTKEDSGLDHAWPVGRWTFCNPPYSLCDKFAEKAAKELERGGFSVLLVPARVETRWFCKSVHGIAQIRFFKGRVRFSEKGSAPFPSVVLVYGRYPNTRVDYDRSKGV